LFSNSTIWREGDKGTMKETNGERIADRTDKLNKLERNMGEGLE
jgi:hypothetical protein